MELEELETGSIVNTYETIVILNPYKYDASVKHICNVCQEYTGKKLKIIVDELGIRNLAYKIKDIYNTGYYLSIYWQGTAENVTELERQMRIDDNVLKFITTKADGDEYELQEFAAIEEESEQDAWDKIFN